MKKNKKELRGPCITFESIENHIITKTSRKIKNLRSSFVQATQKHESGVASGVKT